MDGPEFLIEYVVKIGKNQTKRGRLWLRPKTAFCFNDGLQETLRFNRRERPFKTVDQAAFEQAKQTCTDCESWLRETSPQGKTA